jgi:alanine dehydrogenase
VKVFDVIPEARKEYVKTMSKETNVKMEVASSVKETVKDADIVITCTPSKEAFLKGEMIQKGMHISAIGADTKDKRELDTTVLTKTNKIVVDFTDQAVVVGDFAAPIREGTIKREDIYAELGEIVTGQKKGRTSNEEITLFKATGLAIEDIATAHKVYQLAKKKGIGKEI